MNIIEFFYTYSGIINGVCNIFIALGTVGAVIVALYLSFRDSKPKLKVFTTVGVITPEMSEHLWLSCVNVGKQQITCNSFAFAPRKSKPTRIMPIRRLDGLSTEMPVRLNYSDKADQHFSADFFYDKVISKFLVKYKWLARIQLKYFWRVIVTTNVGTFDGKLSDDVIDKILTCQFTVKQTEAKCEE